MDISMVLCVEADFAGRYVRREYCVTVRVENDGFDASRDMLVKGAISTTS